MADPVIIKICGIKTHDMLDVALRMQPNPLVEHLFRRTVA